MDSDKSTFENLRGILALPFAALFLILLLIVVAERQQSAVGVTVSLMNVRYRVHEYTDCGGTSEFARLTKDGKSWINSEEIPINRISSELNKIMENRAERVVYIVIDPEVQNDLSFDFIDKVTYSISDLHTVLLTPKNFDDYKNSPHDPNDNGIVCDLDWSPRQLKEFEMQNLSNSAAPSLTPTK